MDLPVFNCIIRDNDDTGIYAMSFVECPANEVDFIALSKSPDTIFLNKNTHKQILTGVVLRPDQLIYRNDNEMGEYYIKFSASEIEKIAQKMMHTGIALQNTTHQHQSILKNNYLTELWIIEDPDNDKSKALGFENLPKGTLMCSYKIEDKSYWDAQVMTGNVKGFSLEGFFIQKKDKYNQYNKKNENMSKKNRFNLFSSRKKIQKLEDISEVVSNDETDSGEVFAIYVLSDGTEVYVDKDGFATIDGEQAPAGEHPLQDGNILVIDADGQFVETKPSSDISTSQEEASAKAALKRTEKALAKARKLLAEDDTVTAETIESLTAKYEAAQAEIASLKEALANASSQAETAEQAVEDAQSEIEQLKKQTPSGDIATQRSGVDNHPKSIQSKLAKSIALSYSRKK